MNITDYLVIAAIVISAVVGSLRGFLREAIALVTWIIALFVAWHFSDTIAPHLGGLLSGSPVATWAARVIIVALLLLLGAGIGVTLAQVLRLDGERWWRQSVLMPYGESIASGLRAVIGDDNRARHASRSSFKV
jgi:uncharacterized membrane protein required for colicin V production